MSDAGARIPDDAPNVGIRGGNNLQSRGLPEFIAVPVGLLMWDASQQVQGSPLQPRVAVEDEDWRDWDPNDPRHRLPATAKSRMCPLTISSRSAGTGWTIPIGRFHHGGGRWTVNGQSGKAYCNA